MYEIASKYCKKSICIENAKELNLDEFKNISKVGIMAGASTPQESIDSVIKKLR
jgi:4-hydroxy-3-methylbut-2-enyl diphosphate reductase